MKNKLLLCNKLILLFLLHISAFSQSLITGTVKDSLSNRPLSNVNIFTSRSKTGCTTDNHGVFKLALPAGVFNLSFQHVGYQTQRVPIKISSKDTIKIDVRLTPISFSTEEINVLDQHWISPLAELFQGSHQLTSQQIIDQPGAFEDPLKALQSIPGVFSQSDYTSNLYIRGSRPEDQAVVLDGLLLQNPYRAKILGYGGISIVNSDVIKQLKLSLGGFPSSFGNRLGGLIEINTRDGGPDWTNKISVNLLSARYYLSGAIKHKLGIIFSARRTYYDYLLKTITTNTTSYPFFSDLFFKLTWKPHYGFNFRFLTLIGEEGTNLINNKKVSGNLFTKAKNLVLAASVSGFLSAHLSYRLIAASQFNLDSLFSSSSMLGDYSRYKTNIQRKSIQANIDWEPGSWFYLASGGQVCETQEKASHHLQQLINSQPTLHAQNRYRDLNFFVNSHFKLLKNFRTKLGFRFDYSTINKQLTYDPRAAFRWQLSRRVYAGFAWGIFHQFPKMINLTSKHEPLTPPVILQTLHSPTMSYWGIEMGYKISHIWNIRLEAYSKYTRYLRGEYVAKIENSSTTIRITDNWKSLAKGIELNVAYFSKVWQTQLGYVFSIAQFKKSPHSNWEYQYFDNRHWLNWAIDRRINPNFKISSLIKLTSGFPVSEPVGWSKTNTNEWTVIPVNIYKRHPYFRWDVRFTYHRKHLQLYLEIINLTNHRNFDKALYYLTQGNNGTIINRDVVYMLPRLPLFGFSFSF